MANVLSFLLGGVVAASPVTLVQDLSTRVSHPEHEADWLVSFQDAVYFAATDSEGGRELWRTDGSEAGTRRVLDIRPGSKSSEPHHLFAGSQGVYFWADDGVFGTQLWRSDGTAGGTQRLTSVRPSLRPESWRSSPEQALEQSGVVHFVVQGTRSTVELWRTDDTPEGASRLVGSEAGLSHITSLTAAGPLVYFIGRGANGEQLWRTDGSVTGTFPLSTPGYLRRLTALQGQLYFVARDATHGDELWTTDGTSAGTHLWVDLVPGPGTSWPEGIAQLGSTFYFIATVDADVGPTLWRMDGAAPVNTGIQIPVGPPARKLFVWGGKLYFYAQSASRGPELWVTDGTPYGMRVLEVVPGEEGIQLEEMHAAGDWLYFTDVVSGGQGRLWRTNGALGGTTRVKALNHHYVSAGNWLASLGEALVFIGATSTGRRELWVARPGEEPQVLPGMAKPVAPSDPQSLTAFEGRLYFTALDEAGKRKLWSAAQSAEDVRHVSEVAPTQLTLVGNALYFVGNEDTLYRVDREGAALEVQMTNRTKPVAYGDLHGLDGRLYFTAKLSARDARRALYVLEEGQVRGLSLLTDIAAIDGFTRFQEKTWFLTVRRSAGSLDLWSTDGTEAGTVKVKTVAEREQLAVSSFDVSLVGAPVSTPAALYWVVRNEAFQAVLWRSDGSPEGTQAVPLFPDRPTARLVRIDADSEGVALWVEDLLGLELWRAPRGDLAGLRRVWGLPGGALCSGGFAPQRLTDGWTFVATVRASGCELWSSGAETPTLLDLVPGEPASLPGVLAFAEGWRVFSAHTPELGEELWALPPGRTAAVQVADWAPGAASSNPASLTWVGDTLFFSANGAETGNTELHALRLESLNTLVPKEERVTRPPLGPSEEAKPASSPSTDAPPPRAGGCGCGAGGLPAEAWLALVFLLRLPRRSRR